MTYRLLLWFDMLEEEGKSTNLVRSLFTSRKSLLAKDLSSQNSNGLGVNGFGDGDGIGEGMYGFYTYQYSIGSGFGNTYHNGNGNGTGLRKILAVKIQIIHKN